MSKNLVIVESPAKAKTIAKYLGKDFVVKSSFGHIRDLPKKGMSVDITNNFTPIYEISTDKKKVVSELRKAAKAAEIVWLASDHDREGEAIAWHLSEALKLKPQATKRIVFQEITKPAIEAAVQHPRTIDKDLVDAQQARRILDRIVGYELSPVLWKKVRTGLSAGRVQSVAVRLIVEREREIEAFKPEVNFKVTGLFTLADGARLKAECPTKFPDEAAAQAFLEALLASDFTVSDVKKTPGTRSPSAPFTTSTLQQEASRRLGYSPKQTMMLAQRLYENGDITYMRTDSVNISKVAVASMADFITKEYGADYHQARTFTTKTAGAQEAHEAIRPTDVKMRKAGADAQQQKLYSLIWKRALASQMAPAKLEKTTITIAISKSPEVFEAKGEIIQFPGFLKVYGEPRPAPQSVESAHDLVVGDPKEGTPTDSSNGAAVGRSLRGRTHDASDTGTLLPDVKKGDPLDLQEALAAQTFSRPPARYAEATLVRQLEEMGIGRPSTYAPIISTIQDRGYVEKDDIEASEREVIRLRIAPHVSEAASDLSRGQPSARSAASTIGGAPSDEARGVASSNSNVAIAGPAAQGNLPPSSQAAGGGNPPSASPATEAWTGSTGEAAEADVGVELLRTGNDQFIIVREQVKETPSPDRNKLIPTDTGKVVTDFLTKHFSHIIDYDFTKDVEQEFDEIAEGKLAWQTMLATFYGPFHKTVESSEEISRAEASQARELGIDPKTKKPVTARFGRFGPMVQIGSAEDEEKPRFASIPPGKKVETITLNEALQLFQLPRALGTDEKGTTIEANIGRFGPYIKIGTSYISIKGHDPYTITLDTAKQLLAEDAQKRAARELKIFEKEGIKVLNGQFGPYVTDGTKNAKIPKDVEPKKLTWIECQELLAKAPAAKRRAKRRIAKRYSPAHTT